MGGRVEFDLPVFPNETPDRGPLFSPWGRDSAAVPELLAETLSKEDASAGPGGAGARPLPPPRRS